MNDGSKHPRVDPSAPDLGDDSARGAAARDAEAAAAELKATRSENKRLKEKLAAAEAKNAKYAEMYPTLDANEQLASVVFSHVTDVRTRVALAQVNTRVAKRFEKSRLRCRPRSTSRAARRWI